MLLLLVAVPAATVMKAAEAALVVPARKQCIPETAVGACCAVYKLNGSRTLPDEPLNTFPLQVLLSRLPMSQELRDNKDSLDDRLLIARGTVRQASICSCSFRSVTGDN